MLIHNKDDIEFVFEFPCFFGTPCIINKACYKYYLSLYSCAVLQCKTSNFSYSWALHKKFWLKLRIHVKFRAKKLLISNECTILDKTGFVLIRKWCEISCKTTKLLRKRICCFVETLVSAFTPFNFFYTVPLNSLIRY